MLGTDAAQALARTHGTGSQEEVVKSAQARRHFQYKYALWDKLPMWAKSIEITPDPGSDDWKELDIFGLTIDAASQ